MNTILAFLKNWGDILLSVLVAIGSLVAYVKHDKKIKRQEAKLNELQIKQYEKEEAKEKMAEMKANIIRGHKGNARIRFINAGKVDAKNVRIEMLSTEDELSGIILLSSKLGPYEVINPQSHREVNIALCEGHSDTIKLKIIWDDDFQKNRSVTLSVPF